MHADFFLYASGAVSHPHRSTHSHLRAARLSAAGHRVASLKQLVFSNIAPGFPAGVTDTVE